MNIAAGAVWLGLVLGAAAQCPTCGTDWSPETVPGHSGQAADFQPRRAGAEVAADIRFGISSAGLYRITQPQLVAAGLASNSLVGDRIRLFCRTQEKALTTSTDGLFTTNDYVLFYGSGHRGYYTPTNVYWLAASGTGLRMATLDASTNAGGADVTTHDEVVDYAPDLLYRDFYRPNDDSFDHWFVALLQRSIPAVSNVGTDRRVSGSNAVIVLRLFGLTTYTGFSPDHITALTINGNNFTNFSFDGESDVVVTGRFSSTVLNDGSTTVSLVQNQWSTADDKAYLESYRVCYPRLLGARDGQLAFCGRTGTNLYTVVGLPTNTGLRVWDITDHAAPVALTNFSLSGSGTNVSMHFRTVTATVPRYWVAAPPAPYPVEQPSRVYFRDLSATHRQADYLLITPYAFRDPAYRLLKHRASNNLSVAVAPLEDVYNEFGYGIEDAAAIQQFIGYAFHHWSNPPPRYAALVGDGTYDPRNNLGQKPAVHLPVKLGPTPFSWSPRDAWFGAINGTDTLTDVAIGRMAAVTTQELARAVNKTIAFESATRITNATLVSDNDDLTAQYYFKAATLTNISPRLTAAGYSILNNHLNDNGVATVRNNLSSSINGGRYLVTFFGHGQTHLWCAEDVWNTNDVAGLSNTRYPIVTIFSCQNGSFEDPARECLAEKFVEGTVNGAVAVVAPASESVQPVAERLASGFFAEFTNRTTRLGDSLLAAFYAQWTNNPSMSELWTYGIMGDPALAK